MTEPDRVRSKWHGLPPGSWAVVLRAIIGRGFMAHGFAKLSKSIPMVAVLLVAMFTVHLPYGFSSIKLMAVTSSDCESRCFAPGCVRSVAVTSISRWSRRMHSCTRPTP